MTERTPSSVAETETSEKSDEPPLIEPLTRKGRKRLAETERQLAFAVTLDATTLLQYARLRDDISVPNLLFISSDDLSATMTPKHEIF